MHIDPKLVAELRARAGLPMMKCKQALVDAGGDIEKAVENLRKEGSKTIDKLKDRAMKDGLVFVARRADGAAAVAALCETDFVARSEDFKAFGEALAEALFDKAPADRGDGAALGGMALRDGRTVKAHLDELVGGKIRENMKIGDFARFRPKEGQVAVYVHHNRRIACLVELKGKGLGENDVVRELGNDLGMQIAFHAQLQGLTEDDLDSAWVEKEKEIFLAQAEAMPADKREKIAQGKLGKRLKEVVLLEQPFIKNEKVTVRQHVADVAKAAGTKVEIARFARIGAGA
jgi:elongation factor Ts